MRNMIIAVLGLAMLCACGVDGEPVQPSLNAGVGIGSGGVHVGGAVGLSKGPLHVALGF